MTEFNHTFLGFILAEFVYFMFIRKYDLKFYKEIKKLKSGKNKVTLSPDSMTYDEFIKEKDKNN
jgi:hypothetical protein